jgi:cytochrome c oxidase subunit 1
MNVIFFPMLMQGLAGVNRRLYDGGAIYQHAEPVLYLNVPMSWAGFILAAFQVLFIVNIFGSLRFGRAANTNPWQSTTLEWATPTPPVPHGNFAQPPRAFRSPYEYSVPGAETDFLPQGEDRGKTRSPQPKSQVPT